MAICLALSACTQYRVAQDDGGSGGSNAAGGGTGTPAGGSGGGPAGADGGLDRFDAPVTNGPSSDARLDLPLDTGPVLLANGASCSVGTECQFGNCVDKVCCESTCAGTCQSCGEPNLLGKCVTISGSVRGTARTACPGQGTCASTCNGSDALACHYPGTDKQCMPASCSAGMFKVASTCDSAGACTVVAATACASGLCADPAQCAGGCSATQPCAAGQYCEPGSNACRPLKANGDACLLKLECTSQACVDGVCCGSLCAGQCEACGEPGFKGTCIAVTGAPRGTVRPACSGTRDACRGVCDGVVRTQCLYHGAEVQCTPASCAGGVQTTASVCNMLGDCTMPTSPPCASGQCIAGGSTCLVCTAGLACAGGLVCSGTNGRCVNPATLTITPQSPPSFGSTPILVASASQTFTVTNNGGVAAGTTTGLVPTLSGVNAGEFQIIASPTPCTGPLIAGASCTLVVTFNPQTPGGKSATLSVSATPPGGNVSVTLTGTGLRRLGDACGVTADCPVGACVDGHCCGTPSCATCQSCVGAAGTCAPINNAIDSDSCTGGTCEGGVCKPHGSVLWARSTSNAWLYSAHEGPAGVMTAGTISLPTTANLGGSTLMAAGATDAVLGQFASADATHLASSRFGGSSPLGTGIIYATTSILDASGAPIVGGISYCDPTAAAPCNQINMGLGLANPGGGPGADGFVGRYSVSTGVPTWLATLKGATDDKISALTNGPNGTIFVAGWYSEGLGQSTTLTSGANVRSFVGGGNRDIFIAQLDPNSGAIGMTKTFAGPILEQADAIAWTGSSIIAAGTFAGTTVFGTQPQLTLNSTAFDIWVAKLSPTDGSAIWAVNLGSAGDEKYPSLAVDSSGDIYITGFVGAATTFGGFPVGGAGGLDIFVAKLRNTDGSVVWAKSIGSTGDDTASGIAINASGQIVIVGDVTGSVPGGDPPAGGSDVVIASFSSDGTALWTRVLGTSGQDYGFSVATGSNAFYVAVDLGADIGPQIDGVSIIGPAVPVGLVLKIQP